MAQTKPYSRVWDPIPTHILSVEMGGPFPKGTTKPKDFRFFNCQ